VKAAVRTRYGPPEVVRVRDIPTPVPAEHEVLVKVHVATVNRTDCGFRSGKPFIVRFFGGLTKPRASVLGSEFAGVIESVGAGVTSFAVGDRIFGFSEDRFGTHAECLSIPEDAAIASIPPNVTDEQAASSTEASHYALTNIRAAGIRARQDVLVYGATGAIGTAAVQLLKHLGVTVTAVCATEHVDLVRGLGADRVIDRTSEDFTKDERTYDVVFDAVGKSTFGRCRRLLKPRGIYLSTDLGPLAQNPILAILTPLFRGRKLMFPIPHKRDRQSVGHIKELLASGAFKPAIDRRYPLEDIVDAYRYVELGQKVGNVLIDVAPPRS
jgi:NADPH:quinone reductase-like Zn-dependent oxidoreductase